MARKKDLLKEVVCMRLSPYEDIKAVQAIAKLTKSDSSTVMRGLMRLGLALYYKESQTNQSEALLRIVRAGSFN